MQINYECHNCGNKLHAVMLVLGPLGAWNGFSCGAEKQPTSIVITVRQENR